MERNDILYTFQSTSQTFPEEWVGCNKKKNLKKDEEILLFGQASNSKGKRRDDIAEINIFNAGHAGKQQLFATE